MVPTFKQDSRSLNLCQSMISHKSLLQEFLETLQFMFMISKKKTPNSLSITCKLALAREKRGTKSYR